jgi:hypothetical protein
MSGRFDGIYRRSLAEPEAYWAEAAEDVHWYRRWDKVLDSSNPPFYRWFVGAETNTCYNAVDRHVEAGRGEQNAIIYDSPITGGTQRKITYSELQGLTARFAGVLKKLGIGYGDRVIIYMPMVPEAVSPGDPAGRWGLGFALPGPRAPAPCVHRTQLDPSNAALTGGRATPAGRNRAHRRQLTAWGVPCILADAQCSSVVK